MTGFIEFITDILKGLIRFVLYLAVLVGIEQYAACNTQIPYLEMTIVPGLICDAPVDTVSPSVSEVDYKPMIVSKIHTSANLVTTDKSVDNLVFVVPNDERKTWDQLTKNNETWWDNIKSTFIHADAFYNNLVDGREIKLRVSGKVYGKVNLEDIGTTNITMEKSGNKTIYTVYAPASEILTVDVAPESIEVLGDDNEVSVGLMSYIFKENDEFKTKTIK
jgi:hypothetical protein